MYNSIENQMRELKVEQRQCNSHRLVPLRYLPKRKGWKQPRLFWPLQWFPDKISQLDFRAYRSHHKLQSLSADWNVFLMKINSVCEAVGAPWAISGILILTKPIESTFCGENTLYREGIHRRIECKRVTTHSTLIYNLIKRTSTHSTGNALTCIRIVFSFVSQCICPANANWFSADLDQNYLLAPVPFSISYCEHPISLSLWPLLKGNRS